LWIGGAAAIVLVAIAGILGARGLFAPRPTLLVGIAMPTTGVSLSHPDTDQAVPVLMYHHIMPVPSNKIAISPSTFDEQMRYLHDHGWHAISMAQMQSFVLNGTRLPTKPVLITLDDGRMNQLTYGVPILEKYGFTATFFIVKRWADSPDPSFMHVPQLKALIAAGFDVQSHTTNHLALNRKHGETYDSLRTRAWNATYGMRVWMGTTLGVPHVTALAYPSGYFDDFSVRLAQEAGYDLAFTTLPGYVAYGRQSRYALPRRNAGARGSTRSEFISILTGAERSLAPLASQK
jgi:peptidoglycan/xylan/chitin deacetylase (PgdA/CDA1 family)